MEPRIRELAEELVASFVDRGCVELVANLAVPLPVTVIAEQLGAGTDRLAEFKRWSDHLVAPIVNDRLTEDDILESSAARSSSRGISGVCSRSGVATRGTTSARS
jgi:cytochrome P450